VIVDDQPEILDLT